MPILYDIIPFGASVNRLF